MPVTLVTGATGFIGARLVERLVARGERVACLVRSAGRGEGLAALGAELRVGSLDDGVSLRKALRDTATVYHVAGLTRASRLDDFLEVNAFGTARVCAAIRGDSPPTLVLVSSLAAAGPSPPGRPHTEETPPEPASHYGRSKLEGELLARGDADRLPISIVRPPMVFGPGDRDGLLLFKALRTFPLHAVPQLRGLPLSLVYVDDLVEALIAVADRGQRCTPDLDDPTGLYYAADPAHSSYADVGRMVAAALGKKVWVVCRRKYPFLPVAIAADLWGRVTGRQPIFGMDKLREASASGWVCDPSKLATTLGWSPAAPLADRYRETHAWFAERGWL